MLINDLKVIGNNLYNLRKAKGLTQAEIAEMSDLSDRTYADIERGSTTMRVDTLLKICNALGITPDAILTEEKDLKEFTEEELAKKINHRSSKERETALKLLSIYIDSLN